MAQRSNLSAAEARRVALAAQGFDRPRPGGRINRQHFARVFDNTQLLQLDYVNVLVPAHYLVVWSRLGAYDREQFDHYIHNSGQFTEQWAHEACIVPVAAWPLLEFRRATWKPWSSSPLRHLNDAESYLQTVLEQVREQGAVCANDLPPVPAPRKPKAGDWRRSIPRWALEHHFGKGRLTVRARKSNFQRIYDLPERVIPDVHLNTRLDTHKSQRALLRMAAQACGVANLQDLADYFRMSPRDAAPRIAELVEEGELSPVQVEGWDSPAWLARDARVPRAIRGASLLSPFDPVVWCRPRAERIFDFHYRIEIYVPAARRKWGYYVLPFRVGDDIVARVDLKADRKERLLRVQDAHLEAGCDAADVAARLATELQALADWLQLDTVRVRRRTKFCNSLRLALRA